MTDGVDAVESGVVVGAEEIPTAMVPEASARPGLRPS